MGEKPRPRHVLPVIVFSQFAGGSTWFAGNAVLPELMRLFDLPASALSHLTSAVQLGFITGTLCSAFFNVPDRVSPRVIFLVSSLLNAIVNGAVCILPVDMTSLTVLRFLTGVFLAGIYPIGMQIAASWYREGLGRALGYLVGSLVLGTAFPHLVRGLDTTLPWMTALVVVSVLSATGGLVTFGFVPMGPHARRAARFDPKAIGLIFHSRELRAAAFGYFGHMWELYTMWAFVPVLLGTYAAVTASSGLDVSLWSFGIIAVGSLGCVLGGFVSIRRGSAIVAFVQLAVSGAACVVSPALFSLPQALFLSVMLLWGIVVVGDSPQFSALTARAAPPHLVGSALTIVTSIGFAITIVSIQIAGLLATVVPHRYLLVFLAAGPIAGILGLRPLLVRADIVPRTG